MNALAGGGTFATMPSLIALGLPSPIANATSNVALTPGAAASAWTYRDGIGPVGGLSIRQLAGITFVGGFFGSLLLVVTPTRTFDLLIPWLLLLATVVLAFGKSAANWLHARVTIGVRTLFGAQTLLAVYGGYFGGGVGLMMTATWGLLAGAEPHRLMAPRTLMLATANMAAALVFVWFDMVSWPLCLAMMAGALLGGWLGAKVGQRLSPVVIRYWTLTVTIVTTAIFFWRAYA